MTAKPSSVTMFDSVSRFDPNVVPLDRVPSSVRGDSLLSASFAGEGGRTHLMRTFEQGSLRLRFPRTSGPREGVVVNTGGGITGGDRLGLDFELAAGACIVLTSQAAEKIYRSDGEPSCVAIKARLAGDARLDWLPQETILFDNANVERTFDVEMAASSRLVLLESLVLGRIAHGEMLKNARWRDRWRIRRDGQLLFADDVRLEGNLDALMQRPAVGGSARAIATLVFVAPDAESRLDTVRAALAESRATAGASAWNDMLVARIAAGNPSDMRDAAMRATTAITERAMPRAWSC